MCWISAVLQFRIRRHHLLAACLIALVLAGSPGLAADPDQQDVIAHETGASDPKGLAASYEQAGRFTDAERVYREILAGDETNHEAWFLLGRLYFRAGRLDEAITALEQVTGAQGPVPPSRRQEAGSLLEHVYALRGREWQDALDAGRADLDEAFVFGRGLVNRQRWEEGRRLLARLVAASPDDPQVHYWLAQALLNLGETGPGLRSLVRSVELAPGNYRLRLELALILQREGELGQAERLLAEIVETAEDAVIIGDARRQLAVVRARLAWQAGDPAAGMALEEALALEPDSLILRLMLGDVYAREGRLEQAIRLHEDAAARLAGQPARLAPVHARLRGLYVRKSDLLSGAVMRGETGVDDVIDLVRKLSQHGLHDAVASLAESAIAAFPDDPQLRFWYGRSLLRLGQPEQGVAAIEQSVELSPPNPLLLLELGEAYFRAGRLAEAERVYQEVMTTTRVPAVQRQARRDLGLVRARRFEESGDPAAALSEIESLLAEYPDDRTLLFDSGRLLVMLERDDEAEAQLGRLLAQMPRDRSLRLRMARLYADAGRYSRALALYDELVELAPADLLTRIESARLQLTAGEYDKAFTILTDVFERGARLEHGPDSPVSTAIEGVLRELAERGMVLTRRGDLEAAERVLTGLAEFQPDHPRVHYLLSEVHREQRDHERQAERLQRVVALAPGNLLMQRRLAIARALAGHPALAIPVLEGALQTFPLDSELRAHLADNHARQGDSVRAREEYLKLLRLGPTDEWRMHALERLGLARVSEALDEEDAAEAIDRAQSLLALAPDEPEVVLAMARAWRLGGHDDRAEAAYLRVLERLPGSAEARLELAELYAASGREGEAIEYLDALAKERPPSRQSSTARTRLNILLMARADREVKEVSEVQDPESRLLETGAWMFGLEGYAAALIVFEHMIREYPANAEAYYWFGRLHALLGRHSDSIVLIKRSVDLEPDNPRYHAALGRAYRDTRLNRPALDSMAQALALDESDTALRLELAALLETGGDTAEARRHYAWVLVHGTDDADFRAALDALGIAGSPDHLEEEDLDRTLALMTADHGRMPGSQAARLYVAGLLDLRGQIETARDLLIEIADGDGDPAVRQEAEHRLTAVLARMASAQVADLERGSGDANEARQLGMMLVRRAQPAEAIRLLEAASRYAPEDPQIWYWLGRARILSDDIASGLDALERSVRLAGDNMLLRFELALGYQRDGRLAEAEAQFDRVSMEAEDPVLRRDARLLAMRARAQRLARTGDRAVALALLDEILNITPRDTVALQEKAQVLFALGRHEEADRAFERLLEINPGDVALRMRLAMLYHSRGEMVRSLTQLAAVIQLAPASPEAGQARNMLGYARGVELAGDGELDEAAEVFERLLAAAPNDPETRLQLGVVLFQQRRLAEAEIHLTRAVMLDPARQEAQLLLGRLHEILERRENAIRAYEQAVDTDPESPAGREALASLTSLYNERFREMVAAQRIDEAAVILQRVVSSAPGNIAARINLARLYLQLRRNDEALRELEVVLESRPDDVQAQLMTAVIHAGAGRHLQAVEAYAKAISVDDDEARAGIAAVDLVIEVARLMLAEHRPYAAIRQLRGLADQGRGDERAWSMLATIYHQLGRHEDAIRAYREAVRLAPGNMAFRFNLAELYERSNDDDLALVQYREIVRRGRPGDRFVEEARRRSDILRDRLALFTSQLRYSLILGESVISEQDIEQTGALNSSFTSQLVYNLGTNFRPTPAVHVRLDTGLIYIGNHSTEDDILVPRVGVTGNVNHPRQYLSGSVYISEFIDLMRDQRGGRTTNVHLAGGIRLRDPLSPFSARRERIAETGEVTVARSTRRRIDMDPGPENPRLLASLQGRFPSPEDLQEITEQVPEDPEPETQALASDLTRGMRLYTSAWLLLRQGDLTGAAERFEAVLALSPDDPMTLLHLGIIHQRRLEYQAAESLYLRSLDAGPENPAAGLWLADLYTETGRPDKAEDLLEGLITDESVTARWREAASELLRLQAQQPYVPQDPAAHRASLDAAGFSRGLESVAQGRYGPALEIMQAVADSHPEDPLVRLNLGVILQRLGRVPEAEDEFQRILDADPDNLSAVLRLGMLYAETGRADRALPLLERVVAEAGGRPVGARAEAELERLEQRRLGMLTGSAVAQPDPVNRTFQYQTFYTDTRLPGRNLTETYAYGAGLGLSTASVRTGEWVVNYTYGVRDNEDPWGTDYAYDWHEFGVNWRRVVPNIFRFFGATETIPGLSWLLGVVHERRQYRHADTNALQVDEISRRRTRETTTVTAALNYIVPGYERMSFNLGYSRAISRSNLPIGFVHDPEGNPVAFQSTGLGNAKSEFINLGMSFRF